MNQQKYEQAKLAGRQTHPLSLFRGDALLRSLRYCGGIGTRHNRYAIVIGDNDIPRIDQLTGANQRHIHGPQRCFHRALGIHSA